MREREVFSYSCSQSGRPAVYSRVHHLKPTWYYIKWHSLVMCVSRNSSTRLRPSETRCSMRTGPARRSWTSCPTLTRTCWATRTRSRRSSTWWNWKTRTTPWNGWRHIGARLPYMSQTDLPERHVSLIPLSCPFSPAVFCRRSPSYSLWWTSRKWILSSCVRRSLVLAVAGSIPAKPFSTTRRTRQTKPSEKVRSEQTPPQASSQACAGKVFGWFSFLLFR